MRGGRASGSPTERAVAEHASDGHQRSIERWIADIRAAAVAFALLEVGLLTESYPPGYERWAWALTAVFAAGAAVFLVLARRGTERHAPAVGVAALAFDTLVIGGFAVLYSFEYGSPTRWALVFPVVEAALRYGLPGAIAFGLALVPVFAFLEWWRADRFGPPSFLTDRVSFPSGVMLIVGAIVGTLVTTLRREMARAEERADEAELLRDELGRRADLLDAASRVARAIGSSLDFDEAFTAFSRELRGLVPCERLAIVVVENDAARVLAAGGDEASRALPTGTAVPLAGSLAEEVVRRAQTVYRPDMIEPRFDEEPALTAVGIRSRVGAPLLLGPRAIGILSFSRREPDGFDEREIELVALIGRLVATAVQNIRSHEAERRTVDELRRLSALRADFVSLVSHELRSPMASVIGSARTLQAR
jgi:hypothetical protein